MGKTFKQNITGATPTEIVGYLTIYKDSVQIPLRNLEAVLLAFPKDELHLLAIGLKNEMVWIEYDKSVDKL